MMAIMAISCGDGVSGLTPEEYISENNLDAVELDNGVYIVIHDPGSQEKPNLDDVVEVAYLGKLTDGSVFDQTDNYRTALNTLIAGWQVGLTEIGIGGSCTLIIPHEMGFGNNQVQTIPPKSTLVFDIDLKDIFKLRSVAEYIADNDLETIELDQGVHIAIHEAGNDKKPTLADKVRVNYVGRLTNELIFDQNNNVTFDLANLIQGWQIGLQELGEGGSCTLVVPSEAGYGSTGSGIIPPNEPLVFDLELVKVN